MTDTPEPVFTVVIKKPTILSYGLDILYTFIGILVYFVVATLVSVSLHGLLSWVAAIVALTVGAFALLAVLLLGMLAQRAWTRTLITAELRKLNQKNNLRRRKVRFMDEKSTRRTTTTTYGIFEATKELTSVG